jgi:hypothetical protein
MSNYKNPFVLVNTVDEYAIKSTDESIHVDTSTTIVTLRLPSTESQDVNPGFRISIIDVGGLLDNNSVIVKAPLTGGSYISTGGDFEGTANYAAYVFELFTDNSWRLITGEAILNPPTITGYFNGFGLYRFNGTDPNPFYVDTNAYSNPYNNGVSGLTATNVQAAIDELTDLLGGVLQQGGYAGFSIKGETTQPLLIESNDLIRFKDNTLIKFSVTYNGVDSEVRAVFQGGDTGQILTTTATGVAWVNPAIVAGAIYTFQTATDQGIGTPIDSFNDNTLSILGGGVVSTAAAGGMDGPLITISLTAGAEGQVLTTTGGVAAWGPPLTGAITSLTLSADSGPAQSIASGDTIEILGGLGVDTVASTGDIVTISLNATISDLSNIPPIPAPQAPPIELILVYDEATTLFTWEPISAVGGGFSGLTLAGDTGSQAISDGDTISIIGGSGITTVAGTTDRVVIDLDARIEDLNLVPDPPVGAGNYFLRLNVNPGAGEPDSYAWTSVATAVTFTNLFLDADNNDPATIGDLNTISILGGNGIGTSVDPGTDTVTVSLSAILTDIDNIPNFPGNDGNDYILSYNNGVFTWEANPEITFTERVATQSGFTIDTPAVNGEFQYSSAIFTEGVCYVDSLWGNDGSGVRSRKDRPFLTIQSAYGAAADGDVIHIFPGTYTGTTTLSDPAKSVSFHFAKGVIATSYTFSVAAGCTLRVTGNGDLGTITHTTALGNGLRWYYVEADSLMFWSPRDAVGRLSLYTLGRIETRGEYQLDVSVDLMDNTVSANPTVWIRHQRYGAEFILANSWFKLKGRTTPKTLIRSSTSRAFGEIMLNTNSAFRYDKVLTVDINADIDTVGKAVYCQQGFNFNLHSDIKCLKGIEQEWHDDSVDRGNIKHSGTIIARSGGWCARLCGWGAREFLGKYKVERSHAFYRGQHTGTNNSAVLTDTGAGWTVDQWVGYQINNLSDVTGVFTSSAIIVSNTGDTITATLAGGAENDWDSGDIFEITVPEAAWSTDSGTHSGANNASILTVSGSPWLIDQWVGYKVFNKTDGSTGIITSNTANTITASLSGGVENDWDSGDVYVISNIYAAVTFVNKTYNSVDSSVQIVQGQIESDQGDGIALISEGTGLIGNKKFIFKDLDIKVPLDRKSISRLELGGNANYYTQGRVTASTATEDVTKLGAGPAVSIDPDVDTLILLNNSAL